MVRCCDQVILNFVTVVIVVMDLLGTLRLFVFLYFLLVLLGVGHGKEATSILFVFFNNCQIIIQLFFFKFDQISETQNLKYSSDSLMTNIIFHTGSKDPKMPQSL